MQVLCRLNFTRHWSAEYSLIGGMFTNDFVCRFARYMSQGSYAAWASTAFGQGELLVAGGKLQRRTVARGSHIELYCGHVAVAEFRQSRHGIVCGDML